MSLNSLRQWTPPPGRHQVSMGKSMTSFLKQRKGIQQPKHNNKAMPTSNYYHFKYNFTPESVDTTKPGVVELTNSKDLTSVHVERANVQADDSKVHVFRGKEEPAKEVECVLIYDEDSGTFTLEKLDSSFVLQYDGRFQPKFRPPSASPIASPSPAASTSKIDEDLESEVFRELDKARAEEAAVESDTPLSNAVQTKAAIAARTKRPPPVFMNKGKPAPKLKGSGPSTPVLAQPARSPLASSAPSIPPAQPVLSLPAKSEPKRTEKRKAPESQKVVDADIEELEFGRPTKRTRTSISPPAAVPPPAPSSSSMQLSLPGPAGTGGIVLPGQAPPISLDEDDDEDDWDEVAPPDANNDNGQATEDFDKFAEEMDQELLEGLEEIDPAAEGANANEDSEGDGDGLEDLFGDAGEAGDYDQADTSQKPMSLNAYAGGMDELGDDDDDSTSDDSDDD